MTTVEKFALKRTKAVNDVRATLAANGYAVKQEAPVSDFLDRRADLLASARRGPRIVVEVKSGDHVGIGAVQQVQQLVRSLQHSHSRNAVGLLVVAGKFDAAAQRYAAECSPRVFLATASPKQIELAVDLIAAESQSAGRQQHRSPVAVPGAGV